MLLRCLKTFHLHGMIWDGNAILKFLSAHQRSLVDLEFDMVVLRGMDWPDLLDGMQTLGLQLDSCCVFRELGQNITPRWPELRERHSQRMVNYIRFGKGSNPLRKLSDDEVREVLTEIDD